MMYRVLIVLLIYILPPLIPKKHWIRFYACYLHYTINAIVFPFILIPLQVINMRLHSKILAFVVTFTFKVINIKWILRNENFYEKYKCAIVIVNHQSILDVAGLTILNKGLNGLTGTAKKELMHVPLLAQVFQMQGVIFIDRNKSKESMNLMKRRIRRMQEKKIIIFPEGTRNQRGDGFLKFKYGAFKLAIELKLPIIPVVFSPYTFIKSGKEFSGGEVIISCLKPIETENLLPSDVEDLTNKTRQMMLDEYFKLGAELGENNNNPKVK